MRLITIAALAFSAIINPISAAGHGIVPTTAVSTLNVDKLEGLNFGQLRSVPMPFADARDVAAYIINIKKDLKDLDARLQKLESKGEIR